MSERRREKRTEAMRRRSFFAAVRFFHLGLFRLERLKTDGPNRGWVRSSGIYVAAIKNNSHAKLIDDPDASFWFLKKV